MVQPNISIRYEEEFILNSRGLQLFTCRWFPVGEDIRGLVFLCHGYGVECSIYMKEVGVRLAEAGYAVFGIDVEGHGKSEGLVAYISTFSYVVDDCISFFKSIRGREEYKNKPRFLYGESMGGAVALLIHRKEPEEWNGAVLVAPMCKISEKLKPPQIVTSILTKLAHVVPTWKLVPTKSIIDAGFKDPSKREKMRSNCYVYQDRPRLKTALELVDASTYLEHGLDEVTLPFLLLHGEDDVVTDPAISNQLYETAKSIDKTFRLYPGMWHGLTFGEPDNNVESVFRDITNWLNERTSGGNEACSSPMRQADLCEILQQEQLQAQDQEVVAGNERSSSVIKPKAGDQQLKQLLNPIISSHPVLAI